jgi:hypothetical protein
MWKIWWILAEFEVKELEEALEKLKTQMDEAFAAFLRRAPCPPPTWSIDGTTASFDFRICDSDMSV